MAKAAGYFISVKATEAALAVVCPTPAAKLLLVMLAAQVDSNLQCFPSLATLCRDSGIKSERTVQAHLKALADAGLIRKEEDLAPNGRQTSNVYTLLLKVDGAKPADPYTVPRRRHPNAFKRSGKGVGKAVEKKATTPQILHPPPANSAGTVPANFAPLEPKEINKNAGASSRPSTPPPPAYSNPATQGHPSRLGEVNPDRAREVQELTARLDAMRSKNQIKRKTSK